MQKTTFGMRHKALRFKHFSRNGYSLFSVLGREVLIGTLSVATLSHAKAESVSANAEMAKDSLERKELKLDEVVVMGSRAPLTQSEAAKIVSVITRDDIERAAAETINDVLKLATGVDVRQRGGFGVQTDISVRGGNFDQITILLNGVNISSPHTGHLSADFPVSPDDIERIEIIEGASSRVYGTSAFNGAVNIVTRDGQGLVNVYGGSYGYVGANGRAGITTKTVSNTLSAGYTRSDGATENSAFSSAKVFYQGAFKLQHSSLSLNWQAGYSYKPFEANTFYGAASRDQWESNERWMAAVNATFKLSTFNFQLSTFFNRWYDHYQWHKDSPAGENFHRVESKGASLNAWTDWLLGKTLLGVEVRDERIKSSKLGKPMPEDGHYRYRDQRCNVSLFFEHDVAINRLNASLGLLANMNDGLDTKWRIYPGVDVKYNIFNANGFREAPEHPLERKNVNGKLDLFLSWNMALRMPTFTDLYYSGVGIEGNQDLKPEKSNDVQIGIEYTANGLRVKAQGFYSHKTDMIDWVKYRGNGTTDDIFHSVNFQLDNVGYEADVDFLARELWGEGCPLRKFGVKYSYISEKSDYQVDVISSKYAMDYLRHKLLLNADGRVWKRLNLSLNWRWQDRVGADNAPYALMDGRLSWDARHYSLYVNATNIFNKEYYDYVSIRQPGRCFIAGMKWMF
ncbi:MAG: TonB-dependent receptor [Prevotella sp.]|nr:TonB-dependent receptor [Prevotella sp.]